MAIASRDKPLTARVMANRVWLHLFGAGIVTTPDNFGASGVKPSNPQLLDTLAVTFMDEGWSVKRLIRRIVFSRAYQLSSQHDDKNYEVDPDNALVWRMARKRQDAESLRDSILAISGQLDRTPLVGSVVARAGEEIMIGGARRPPVRRVLPLPLPTRSPGSWRVAPTVNCSPCLDGIDHRRDVVHADDVGPIDGRRQR